MMVFHKAGLVYLAVPKTASTALEDAFGAHASALLRDPPGLKHSNARKFNRKLRRVFEAQSAAPLETVAVIREPLSWLGSWFRYRQRPFLNGKPNSTAGMDFADFVEAYLQPDPPKFAQIGSQARFLCDENGTVLADHLFAYERLDELVVLLSNRLNIAPQDLERTNSSPTPSNFSKTLPDAIDDQLHAVCARDFELHRAALR